MEYMFEDNNYCKTTKGITVSAYPLYMAEESDPDDNKFVWAYHVTIENNSEKAVKLLKRKWLVADARGIHKEIKGDGVMGEQPVLDPGDSFEYTSGAPLSSASGIMVGEYQMESNEGELFNVDVPAFSLDSPHTNKTLN
jgi:ApaG protein